jgi:hypothetical protein
MFRVIGLFMEISHEATENMTVDCNTAPQKKKQACKSETPKEKRRLDPQNFKELIFLQDLESRLFCFSLQYGSSVGRVQK